MKHYVIVLVVLTSFLSLGQKRIYLGDALQKVTSDDLAQYYMFEEESPSIGLAKQTTYYIANDSLYSKGYVQLTDKKSKSGTWRYYYKNGNIKFQRNYDNGRIIGKTKSYFKDGSLRQIYSFEKERRSEMPHNVTYLKNKDGEVLIEEGNGIFNGAFKGAPDAPVDSLSGKYINSVPHGLWKGYKNNKLIMEERYKNGDFISGYVLINGKKQNYTQFYEPGKPDVPIKKLYQKFSMNAQYYMDKMDLEVDDKRIELRLRFYVYSDGEIGRIAVLDGLGKGPDEVVIRAFKRLDLKWNPSKLRGVPVPSYFTMPCVFGSRDN